MGCKIKFEVDGDKLRTAGAIGGNPLEVLAFCEAVIQEMLEHAYEAGATAGTPREGVKREEIGIVFATEAASNAYDSFVEDHSEHFDRAMELREGFRKIKEAEA